MSVIFKAMVACYGSPKERIQNSLGLCSQPELVLKRECDVTVEPKPALLMLWAVPIDLAVASEVSKVYTCHLSPGCVRSAVLGHLH